MHAYGIIIILTGRIGRPEIKVIFMKAEFFYALVIYGFFGSYTFFLVTHY
jgi:hypothetical protein